MYGFERIKLKLTEFSEDSENNSIYMITLKLPN